MHIFKHANEMHKHTHIMPLRHIQLITSQHNPYLNEHTMTSCMLTIANATGYSNMHKHKPHTIHNPHTTPHHPTTHNTPTHPYKLYLVNKRCGDICFLICAQIRMHIYVHPRGASSLVGFVCAHCPHLKICIY